MPPRRQARNTTETKTHFHIVVADGEGNTIRFGPFTADDILSETTEGYPEDFTPTQFAEDFASDVANLGLEQTLAGLYLWGDLRVRLVGDDGTKLDLCEIPYPNL